VALSKYLVFEGTDGSGKTTVAERVFEALPEPKIFTKEPGSPHIPLCMDIREEILHNASQSKDPLMYAYLFAADTKIHMERVVKPALKNGKWVVSDRSVMSDFAYRPRDGNNIRQENFDNFMRQHPMVFMVDVPDKIASQRMKSRSAANEFEKAHVVDKLKELRHNYYMYSMAKFNEWVDKYTHNEGMWYIIDNTRTVHQAFMQVMGLVIGHFPEFNYLLRLTCRSTCTC
jgi:dTMP kinase